MGIRLELAGEGWCRVDVDGVEAAIDVRFALSGRGALIVSELRIADPDGISGRALRGVALGQIERLANLPGNATRIKEHIGASAPEIGHRFVETQQAGRRHADDVETIGVGLVGARRGRSLRLSPPSGRRYPDAFYKRVAEVYTYAAATERAPAVAIAKASGVETTTVHRWVKEARSRGLLPREGIPGKRGV